jgi:hypothetical protein
MQRSLPLRAATALSLIGAISACQRPPAQDPPPSDAPSTTAVASAPPLRTNEPEAPPASSSTSFEKTVGIVSVPREGFPRMQTGLRAAAHQGFDRVVFEFQGGVPGFHLEYIDHPVRDCGAGEPQDIAGDAHLEVRMSPANAHTEEGKPTVPGRELKPGLPNVREIQRTCDFEAVVTWVIGVGSPNRYRAFELADPPRLVVDIDHER